MSGASRSRAGVTHVGALLLQVLSSFCIRRRRCSSSSLSLSSPSSLSSLSPSCLSSLPFCLCLPRRRRRCRRRRRRRRRRYRARGFPGARSTDPRGAVVVNLLAVFVVVVIVIDVIVVAVVVLAVFVGR